jgi:hypothetical protein
VSSAPLDRQSPAEAVAGFLAALAIFAAATGVAWHPLRLIPIAALLALIAAGIGGRYRRLAFAAVMLAAVCFFIGMTIAILTERPLW